MYNNLNKIIKKDWVSRWAGSYTFISASYWGAQYKESLFRELGVGFNHSLFIHRKGTIAFYLLRKELDNFGMVLSGRAIKDNKSAIKWCKELKQNTDIINSVMDKLHNTIPNYKDYQEFIKAFDRHLPYHNAIKKTVDYFPIKTLDKLLPYFKEARLYSELVYSDTESFFRGIMKKISSKESYNKDYLTCLTKNEFEKYLKYGVLPKEEILKQRFKASVLYFENADLLIKTGKQVDNLDKLILKKSKENRIIKGTVAYKGVAKGRIRIVLDPHKAGIFHNGDILVTGMTRPEFLPLVKKAAAIVTEAGGILSHAAITARELKKPCVTGVPNITSLLKDGDLIEVNADKGLVILLNK